MAVLVVDNQAVVAKDQEQELLDKDLQVEQLLALILAALVAVAVVKLAEMLGLV